MSIKENYKDRGILHSFRFWVGFSLIIHLIAAWFSLGFIHYDEHFQILEFAGMKLGWTRPETLPWEYNARIRPALQPAIVYGLIKAFGLTDRLNIAFILRLISGLFGWAVAWFFTFQASRQIAAKNVRNLLYVLTALYGFEAFIHVRFSSESWSGTTCFLGLSILLYLWNNGMDLSRRSLLLILCGFCFGLSYVFRMQVAIVPLSVVIWALLSRKMQVRDALLIVSGGIVAVALGFIADRWFYGQWVNTTFNYFHANIIENKAAHFGVMPWFWFFFAAIVGEVSGAANWNIYIHHVEFTAGSVLCLIMVLCFILLWISRPKSFFTSVSLPFFIVHSLIAHKELRFLFPLIDLVPFVIVFTLCWLYEKAGGPLVRYGSFAAVLALAAVGILNLPYIKSSAWENFSAYKFMNRYKGEDLYLMGYKKDLYQMNTTLPMMFYKPAGFHIIFIKNMQQVDSVLRHTAKPIYIYIPQKGFGPPSEFNSMLMTYNLVYCTIPMFLKPYNFNQWQKRTSACAIYRIWPSNKLSPLYNK